MIKSLNIIFIYGQELTTLPNKIQQTEAIMTLLNNKFQEILSDMETQQDICNDWMCIYTESIWESHKLRTSLQSVNVLSMDKLIHLYEAIYCQQNIAYDIYNDYLTAHAGWQNLYEMMNVINTEQIFYSNYLRQLKNELESYDIEQKNKN